MKSCGVCALGCSAFRGSDRFTVTKSVQEGRGISLSRRDLPVISALVAIRQATADEKAQIEEWADITKLMEIGLEVLDQQTTTADDEESLADIAADVDSYTKLHPPTRDLFYIRVQNTSPEHVGFTEIQQ
jgi:hypothetical protein